MQKTQTMKENLNKLNRLKYNLKKIRGILR